TPNDSIISPSIGDNSEFENARFTDYVGIDPIASTNSKADAGSAIGIEEFKRLASRVNQPAVAVGGITPAVAKSVLGAGAAGVAVLSGIFSVSDPGRAASSYLTAIET